MGICKQQTSVSFDVLTKELVEKWRVKHSPLLDDSFSAAVRFIVRQYDSFMEALLSRPDMMVLMVDAQQRLLINKFAQVPLQSAAETRGPESSDKSTGIGRGTRPLDGFLGRKIPQGWAKNWTAESGRPI